MSGSVLGIAVIKTNRAHSFPSRTLKEEAGTDDRYGNRGIFKAL